MNKSSSSPSVPVPSSSLATSLRALVPGRAVPDAWRAAACALLRVSPQEGEALGLLFEESSTSDETRLLVLDLLAGAGTLDAQVVMRRLLSLAVARECNRTFASFVQRLAMVARPDGATLRFLMSVYAESKGEPLDVRGACAYALGAAAGRARTSGEHEAALRASDVLRRDLLRAGSTPEKCALLTALGNAGVPTDAIAVTRFASDSDARVRAAAALAFRNMDTEEVHAQLVRLLADRDPKVAENALVALRDQLLVDGELEHRAEIALRALLVRLAPSNVSGEHRLALPERERIVELGLDPEADVGSIPPPPARLSAYAVIPRR